MKKIAKTPSPPYVCAVFTSIRTDVYEGYEKMNDNLFKEIHTISGYLGNEYFRDENGFGINVSYSNLSISCFHFLFHKAKYIESFEQPNIYFYLPKFKILKNHIVKKKWDESLLRRSQTN